MRNAIIILAISLLFAAPLLAQPIIVDLNRAQLAWQWSKGTGSDVNEFRVKCGQSSGAYTKVTVYPNPAQRTAQVRDVIAGSGVWYCIVTAANQYGEAASNEVPFDAGAAPSSPFNLQVQ